MMSNALQRRALLQVVAIALSAVALCCCVRDKDGGGKVRDDLPLHLLQDGDLLLRRGVSLESQTVMHLDSGGQYTHIGIAINEDGVWKVVHAVPGENRNGIDQVKIEPVDSFFLTTRAEHGAVMRVTSCDTSMAHRAARWARARCGMLFDDRYNWSDTSRLYCTELVQRAYESVGIDLNEGRATHVVLPVFKGHVVFPSDLLQNTSLKTIFKF